MKKIFLIPVALILMLSACTERIDIELNDQDTRRLVVEGWFTDQLKQHEVKLTYTTSYFENQAAPVAAGAVVSISDGTTTWNLEELAPGRYFTPEMAGTPEQWYYLNIEVDGEEYTASSWMRPVADVDSLHVRVLDPLVEYGFPGDPYYSVRVWTQELPGQGDRYMWLTYVNNEGIRDTLRELTFVDDVLYDGAYVEDVEIDYLEIETEANIGDTVRIEQFNIGEEAYDIFIGIMNETDWNGGLFDAPPANVATNISNGALGFWGAASVREGSTIIAE
ncbi:MAG: DUF4249 family protein [Cryomorphaceae bacterium]|nr:DUF4249 family protein [Cryomorphaceae bacterium]